MRAFILLFVLFLSPEVKAYQQVLTETGQVVAWPTDEVAFTIHEPIPAGWDKASVEATVLASKTPWEALECGALTMQFDGWSSAGSPDLFDKKNGIYWIQDEWQFGSALMAITLLEFSKFTGELRDADILVNNNQKVFDVGPVCDSESLNYNLQNILTHEFGHFVGLNHSDDSQATMFADTFEGDCVKRDLHPDDEAGFCATYDREDVPSPDANDGDAGFIVEGGEHDNGGCQAGRTIGPTNIPIWLSAMFGWLTLWFFRRRKLSHV